MKSVHPELIEAPLRGVTSLSEPEMYLWIMLDASV